MTSEIVVVNFYSLRDPQGFDRALRVLVPRVRLQGHEGLRSYRFFGSGPKERRLVAIYEGPSAWVGHHDLIMAWPEMVALRAAARLARTDLYGPITPPMQAWIEEMGLAKKLRHQGEAIAGFRR
ncbi:hypothetical protein [Tabrizicola sp.]|uniref:hypothetical protein n=1 Tax=Tabrizicola sp. TaxID=2005166 RepID=UPI0027340EAD|nr:hypothetical protein [Tabrizicola sp.]MDP3193649.1 hypothetical protein [Tabrizicola sp.]